MTFLPIAPKRLRRAAFAFALLALGGAIALGAAIWRGGWTAAEAAEAPPFEYVTLDGRRHRSDGLRGQVVLVSFWATTCRVCLREMPELIALHRRLRERGFETLAVAVRSDPPVAVVDYAQSRRLPFPVVIDHVGDIARRLGPVPGTPTLLLIDRRGTIVERHVGETDIGALGRRIEALLAAS